MEEHLTPERIVNSILMDSSYKGIYLLVEGKKDIKLYKRLVVEDAVKIRPSFGKYKMRTVYQQLTEKGFSRKIGIRDSDFLRLSNNPKFDPNFIDSIFVTDCHDAEMMMLEQGCLLDFLAVISDEVKVRDFEKVHKKTIKDLILDNLYNFGCLKLANKRFSLGLVFKPERVDGPILKLDKFICDKTWKYLGHEKMVQAARDYSNNKSKKIASKEEILEKLLVIFDEKHAVTEIVHGHDSAELLRLISKHGLKADSRGLPDSDCIENLLTMGFDLLKFSKTQLYAKLDAWEKDSNVSILRPVA